MSEQQSEKQTEHTFEEQPISRGVKILAAVIVGVPLLLIAWGVISAVGGDNEAPAQNTETSVTESVETNDPSREEVARDVESQLNPFFDCEWEREELDDWYQSACLDSGLAVYAFDSQADAESWTGILEDDEDFFDYMVLGDRWMVATVSKSDMNHAWDVLGAEGERITPTE